MTKDIMDVKEVAGYLGFSPTKIYRMLTSGEIPSVKVGGQYRFPKAKIDEWLEGKLTFSGSTRSTKSTKSTERVEDRIVNHLVRFLKKGSPSERGLGKRIMAGNLDVIDWQYLAGQAEAVGVLPEAIEIEKEINNRA